MTNIEIALTLIIEAILLILVGIKVWINKMDKVFKEIKSESDTLSKRCYYLQDEVVKLSNRVYKLKLPIKDGEELFTFQKKEEKETPKQ